MSTTFAAGPGQTAPDFKLRGPGGAPVTLSEYRGHRNVILVFYPLAFSPVCSHQLPALERDLPQFRALDAEVLGISVDSHHANTAFARTMGISFPLLSDWTRETSAAYGVLLPTGHSARATFIVDKQGRVAHRDVSGEEIDDPAGVPSHQELFRVLHALEGR
jgi:peroxiredoxin (alkyl hydroperoxide reductase subunit C)